MKKFSIFLTLFLLNFNSFAESFTLDSLSQSEVDEISKEFAANFSHTTVAPASTLGQIFGFEIGLLGGMTTSTTIDKVAKEFDASSGMDKIPHVGIMGAVSLPLGFTVEANFIPKITTDANSLYNVSGAVKWTATSLIPAATFDLALRVHSGLSEFSYSSVINNTSTGNQNVNTKASWKNSSFGFNVEFSKKLLFIEPYIGYGRVNTTTDIGLTANTTVSIFTFSSANSYSASNSGSHIYYGLNLNLFILKIGGEYSKVMGVEKYTGKATIYF